VDFLAGAIAAVKDGSEPRIQLEMALLKATQPQADLSIQALMFRIEQLEARLAGEPEPVLSTETPVAAPRTPTQRAGASAAVAVESEPEPPPQALGALELEQLQAIWPAVAEAVTEENGMLGAALGAARPLALEGDRLIVAFPPDAAFIKKKAEASREMVQRALRGLSGQVLDVAYELRESGDADAPALLDEEQLIERLRAEFAAEEVFETEGE
jgi:DNA polymerase III subunit gamma/tau